MQDKKSDLQGSVDASAAMEQVQQSRRGHGEVGVTVRPLIAEALVKRTTRPNYQTITIQITKIMVTMA